MVEKMLKGLFVNRFGMVHKLNFQFQQKLRLPSRTSF